MTDETLRAVKQRVLSGEYGGYLCDLAVEVIDEALRRGAAHQEAFAAQCESVGRINELSRELATARGLLARARVYLPREGLVQDIDGFLAGAPA